MIAQFHSACSSFYVCRPVAEVAREVIYDAPLHLRILLLHADIQTHWETLTACTGPHNTLTVTFYSLSLIEIEGVPRSLGWPAEAWGQRYELVQ